MKNQNYYFIPLNNVPELYIQLQSGLERLNKQFDTYKNNLLKFQMFLVSKNKDISSSHLSHLLSHAVDINTYIYSDQFKDSIFEIKCSENKKNCEVLFSGVFLKEGLKIKKSFNSFLDRFDVDVNYLMMLMEAYSYEIKT